jgi:hypothetical protein
MIISGSLYITGSAVALPKIPNSSTGSFTGSAGNLWFNTDLNQIQYTFQSGSYSPWTTGASMITARQVMGAAGNQTNTTVFGGYVSGDLACTEKYNGTSWAVGGIMITARNGIAGTGTSISALAIGGNIGPASSACTEAYDGTSWSVKSRLILTRNYGAAVGVQTSALVFGGLSGGAQTAATERFDGTTWTSNASGMNVPKAYLGGAGTGQGSAMAFGGQPATFPYPYISCSETFNGTSWSGASAMNTARGFLGGAGIVSAALAIGGYNTPINLSSTETFNGSSWSSTSSMITARRSLAGAGSQNAAIAVGGIDSTVLACTELFTLPARPIICTCTR